MNLVKSIYFLLTPIFLIYSTLLSPAVADWASEWDTEDFGKVRLISGTTGLGQHGQNIPLGLEFQLDPGWKIYWRSPGDAGSPPTIDSSTSNNLSHLEMHWPWPTRLEEAGDLTTVGYLGHVVFPITVSAEDYTKLLELRFFINYQACKTICIPISAFAGLTLPSGNGKLTQHNPLIEYFKKRVPLRSGHRVSQINSIYEPITPESGLLTVTLTSKEALRNPSIFVEGAGTYRFGKERIFSNTDLNITKFLIPISNVNQKRLQNEEVKLTLVANDHATEHSHRIERIEETNQKQNGDTLILILVTALFGGLILNLMPCVLPVLSIKILNVFQSIGSEAWKVRASFFASAAGIIFCYLLLAIGTIGLQAAGKTVGWGMQFQEPLFLIFLIFVLTLFSSTTLGLFEIRSLPFTNFLMRPKNSDRWLTDSFWTGAFATLLATPCSAPFVGTSISFALSQGKAEILVIFLMLGIGMAVPYLLFGIKPQLVTLLPKPGKWMLQLRGLLGISLVATTLWLLLILSNQTNGVMAWSIGAAMLICATLLSLSTKRPAKKRYLFQTAALVILGCSLIITFMPTPSHFRNNQESAIKARSPAWVNFDLDSLALFVQAGKTVFVDITADWCLTCKINKKLVLDRPELTKLLESPEIVWMRGDWTKRDPQIQKYLISFNRFGIPFNAVYGSAAPSGILLPELLNKNDVLSALKKAGQK